MSFFRRALSSLPMNAVAQCFLFLAYSSLLLQMRGTCLQCLLICSVSLCKNRKNCGMSYTESLQSTKWTSGGHKEEEEL